jgi:protein gp37
VQVTTMRGKTLTANIVVTRMKHGSTVVLHISMVDVTDLKRLLEVRQAPFSCLDLSIYTHAG